MTTASTPSKDAGPGDVTTPDSAGMESPPSNWDDELMDPDNSPSRPGVGVRRVNNVPVAIVAAALAVFALVVAYVAVGRAHERAAETDSDTVRGARDVASEITRGYEAGEVPRLEEPGPAREPPPAALYKEGPEPGRAELPDGFPAPPPLPPSGDGRLKPPQSSDKAAGALGRDASGRAGPEGEDAMAGLRMEMLQKALGAKTTVDVIPLGGEASSSAGADGGGRRYAERLREMQEAGLLPGGSAATTASSEPTDAYAEFGASGDEDRWALGAQMEAPRGRYELRAGAVIPATMLSGINSDLPGQITAIVAQDVRDTAIGRHVLIPQTSRLVGTYGSDVKYGQERVLVAWQRIVFPDGKALDIGAMPGADGAGYAGFKDLVNNHRFRLFANAILMSGIMAGIASTQPEPGDRGSSFSGALSEALGQQLGQLTEEMIRKEMDVSPTIEIRPGYRFNVQVTKDLTFNGPYVPFDYDRSISSTDQEFRVRYERSAP